MMTLLLLLLMVPMEWHPGCWWRLGDQAIVDGLVTVEDNRAFLHDKVRAFLPCRLTGPEVACIDCACDCWDIDRDGDIDLRDVAKYLNWLSGIDNVIVRRTP